PRGPGVPGPHGGYLRGPDHRGKPGPGPAARPTPRSTPGGAAGDGRRVPGPAADPASGPGEPPDRPHPSALRPSAPGGPPADGGAAARTQPAASRTHHSPRPAYR